MANVKFKGGKEFKKLLDTALKNGKERVEVGFFEGARYINGTQVAHVAAIHQFGAPRAGIPERPYFSNANRTVKPKLLRVLVNNVDTKNMVVDQNIADKLGLVFSDELKAAITRLRTPQNKPQTIKAKGSSNPLIDTGLMRQSATWEVIA